MPVKNQYSYVFEVSCCQVHKINSISTYRCDFSRSRKNNPIGSILMTISNVLSRHVKIRMLAVPIFAKKLSVSIRLWHSKEMIKIKF